MTIKTRLAKLEQNTGTLDEYEYTEPGRLMELVIPCCVERYMFSEEEVRKRLAVEIENDLNQEPEKIKINDSWINEDEIQARLDELVDMFYLKYFTDTKNHDIPKYRMLEAIQELEKESDLTKRTVLSNEPEETTRKLERKENREQRNLNFLDQLNSW